MNELTNYKDLMPLASELAKSNLCPAHLKSPANALYALLRGQELGLKPIYSLENISVINGKTTLSADAMLAICKGNSEYGGCEIKDTATSCTVTMSRNYKNGVKDTRTVTFTMDDARKAGLVRQGSNYEKYPARMLKSRAQAFVCRDLFGDILAGVYSPEEITDGMSSEDAPIKTNPVSVETIEPTNPMEMITKIKECASLVDRQSMVSSLRDEFLSRINEAKGNKDMAALDKIETELKARLAKEEEQAKSSRKRKPAPVEEVTPTEAEQISQNLMERAVETMSTLLNKYGYVNKHAVASINKHCGTQFDTEKTDWKEALLSADIPPETLAKAIAYWEDAMKTLKPKSEPAPEVPVVIDPKREEARELVKSKTSGEEQAQLLEMLDNPQIDPQSIVDSLTIPDTKEEIW